MRSSCNHSRKLCMDERFALKRISNENAAHVWNLDTQFPTCRPYDQLDSFRTGDQLDGTDSSPQTVATRGVPQISVT
jgi:hypothetical protein